MYSVEEKYRYLLLLFNVKAFVFDRTDFDALVTRLVTVKKGMDRVSNNNNRNNRYDNLRDSHRRIIRLLKLDTYNI